ncbi:hypothetical protein [Lysobacter sp. CA199]|uniref:hypothetical protein n=1 Tax=Lysobacter sp. CA199 TaxID=3455608 RepID=UPI003F8D2E25
MNPNQHSQHRANPPPDPDARFDAAVRDLHARAVDSVSPQIRARLRTIRSEAAAQPQRGRGGLLGWALAGSGAFAGIAALALVVNLQLGANPGPASAQSATAVPAVIAATAGATSPDAVYDPDTAVASLDENPDLYLWLASNSDALPSRTHTE